MSDSLIDNSVPIPENGQSPQNGNRFIVWVGWILGKFWNLIMFSIQTNTKALLPFTLLFILRLSLTFYSFYSVDSVNGFWSWLIGFVVYIVDFLIGLILIARAKLSIDESVDKKINVKF